MKESSRTKSELLSETSMLKQKTRELETLEANRKRLEDDMREREEYAMSLFTSSHIPLIVMDAETGIYIDCNSAAVEIYGYATREEVIGKTPLDMSAPIQYNGIDSATEAKKHIQAGREKGSHVFEWRHQLPNGQIWDAHVHLMLLQYRGKSLIQFTLQDITEHKRVEEKLRASEARYRTLVENASDIVYETDSTGHFTFVNQAALHRVGYKEEEIIGKHYSSLIRPDMRDEAVRFFGRQFVKGIQNTFSEYPIISKEGNELWIGQNTQVIVEAGHVKGFQAVARDITDRRQVEEALRESEEKFRSVVERSLVGIAIIDDAFEYTYVNEEFCKMAGYLEQEILGKNFTFLLAEESKLLVADRNRRRQLGEDVPSQYEFLFVQKNGAKRTGEVRSSLYLDSSGKTKVIIQVIDITERLRTDEVLREREEKYRLIAENTADLITVTDMNLCFTYISPSIMRTHGYTVEEAMNISLDRLLTPRSLQNLLEAFAEEMQLEATGTANPGRTRILEFEEYKKDGSIVWLESSVSAQRDQENKPIGLLTVSRVITERKHAEEALRKSEEKHRTIIEQMDDGYFEIDLAGNFTFVNDAECKILGYSIDELIGMNNRQFQDEASAKKAYQLFNKIYRTGEPVKGVDVEIIRKNGTKGFHEDSLSLVRDTEGKPIGFRGLSRDITKRKRSEEEKRSLEERLYRAEKMEALGQLAGGVAHDLNNVLGILSGYSELLLMEIPEGQRARGHVEKIFQSTEKGAAIIQDLLTLARRGVTVSDVINLNKVVADFLQTPVFEKMKDFHPRVTFRTECQDELLNIKGSPVHLEKTLMNLVSNAAESISGVGEVTIRTENRYLDKPIRGYDEIKEGDYTILTVSDTGMGIPAEHKEKIFEPFYTKKTMGRSGTGLGLAIVWGTVKDHNGYIDVQTEVGEGTTFTLYFPVTREELLTPQQKVPIERYMGNGESVLVVDDIAEQRDVASGLLTQLGYRVHTVSGGEEAAEYLRENKADILVLDMIMSPGIDGLETYQRVLKINPQQKAILVSGFSETYRVKEAQKLGAGAYVSKPYVLEKIGVAIRDELKK